MGGGSGRGGREDNRGVSSNDDRNYEKRKHSCRDRLQQGDYSTSKCFAWPAAVGASCSSRQRWLAQREVSPAGPRPEGSLPPLRHATRLCHLHHASVMQHQC